jgi:hypothetical protein
MSKQDIEKRLGFAAQGVKETTRTSAKAAFASPKYRAFVYRGSPSSNRLVKATEWMASASAAEDAAKQVVMSLRDKPGYNSNDYFADIEQETPEGAKTVKNYIRFSRPGVKAKMGFLSRVGYAATALTADPADPKSPEYRKQVSEAKAAAKDAITNYKFMRDKVKERLAALDAYVTNAIKVINSATSAKDIEHYVEQLRIAVKSQSMILGASKSPFSRAGAKAKFADAALDQIRNNAAISDKILTLVSKGLSVPQAIDSVLGEGTYKRIGSEVYDELKKAKSSRLGVKAKA